MAEKLRLFVSATLDLESARAVVGRAVAGLPVKTGIEIRRTPVEGASYEDIFELIANVDRVYFLLGRDITAPAGAEWDLAWKLDRSLMPLRAQAYAAPKRPKSLPAASLSTGYAFNPMGSWRVWSHWTWYASSTMPPIAMVCRSPSWNCWRCMANALPRPRLRWPLLRPVAQRGAACCWIRSTAMSSTINLTTNCWCKVKLSGG